MQLENPTNQLSPVKKVLSPIKQALNANSTSSPLKGMHDTSRNILDQIGDMVTEDEKKQSNSPIKSFGAGDGFAFKLTQI